MFPSLPPLVKPALAPSYSILPGENPLATDIESEVRSVFSSCPLVLPALVQITNPVDSAAMNSKKAHLLASMFLASCAVPNENETEATGEAGNSSEEYGSETSGENSGGDQTTDDNGDTDDAGDGIEEDQGSTSDGNDEESGDESTTESAGTDGEDGEESGDEPLPSCEDAIENGDETDVDCGGGLCDPCADGLSCAEASDCQSAVCTDEICQEPTCEDLAQNAEETDIDCGGESCDPCTDGLSCSEASDCQSGVCTDEICQEPSCEDLAQNAEETDVDCGGSLCDPCGDGMTCLGPEDCDSGVCTEQVCQEARCDDGVQNGDETGLDCGGSCNLCPLSEVENEWMGTLSGLTKKDPYDIELAYWPDASFMLSWHVNAEASPGSYQAFGRWFKSFSPDSATHNEPFPFTYTGKTEPIDGWGHTAIAHDLNASDPDAGSYFVAAISRAHDQIRFTKLDPWQEYSTHAGPNEPAYTTYYSSSDSDSWREAHPALAVRGDEGYMAYLSHEDGGGENPEHKLTLSVLNATTGVWKMSETEVVAPQSDPLSSPTVTVAEDGRVWVVWSRCPSPSYCDVYYNLWNPGDGSWELSTPARTHVDPQWNQSMPRIVPLKGGKLLIAWRQQNTQGYSWTFRLFNADGSAASDEAAVTEKFYKKNTELDLAPLRDGGFALMWSGSLMGNTSREMLLHRYDAEGNPVTEAPEAPWGPISDKASEVAIAATESEILALWTDSISGGIAVYGQRLGY